MLEELRYEQQKYYAELRSEFRSENQKRIHSQLKSHPVGWGIIGDSEKARDRYDSGSWVFEMLGHLDAPVVQDFGLNQAPLSLSEKVEEYAIKSVHHDSVTWEDQEGVVDHDAPACKDVFLMSDDELCDYVNSSVEGSREI